MNPHHPTYILVATHDGDCVPRLGEQSETAEELELYRLRRRVAELERLVGLGNEATAETAEHVTELVREEREACARVAEAYETASGVVFPMGRQRIAAAIRARGGG